MEYNTDDILKNMEEAMYDLILERITTDEDVEDCYLVNDVANGKLQIMYMEQAFENGKLRGKSLIDLMRNSEGLDERAVMWIPDSKAIHEYAERFRPQVDKILARL